PPTAAAAPRRAIRSTSTERRLHRATQNGGASGPAVFVSAPLDRRRWSASGRGLRPPVAFPGAAVTPSMDAVVAPSMAPTPAGSAAGGRSPSRDCALRLRRVRQGAPYERSHRVRLGAPSVESCEAADRGAAPGGVSAMDGALKPPW